MHRTVDYLDWITIVAYGLVLCGIALYHSRKMKTQDDILLAGRSMSRWPIAMSMYMALFSTNTFVGVTGWLNRPNGTVWIGLQNIGIILAVPFVVWLYPVFFFRLRVSTAYEYLERRFDYSVRLFATVFFLGSRMMWMATMLYSSGLVVSLMLGWTPQLGVPNGQLRAILIIGALGTFFGLAGGMHAVIWTDVVQFFVMMGGVVTMAVFAIVKSGGLVHVMTVASQAGKFHPPPVFSLNDDLSIVSGLLLGFIAMLSSSGADQMILQTYLTARSEVEAKRSLWRNGLILKPMSLMFPCLGLIMFVYYRAHPQVASLMRIPDDALSVFVLNVLPSGMRGLMIIAIVSAVLTSLESGMAATSAAVQVDFVRRWRKRPLSDRGAVLLGRCLIFTWGVIIVAIALWVQTLGARNNIIQILNIIMYPFAGVLLGIFLLGMLTRRANSAGTLIGAAAGFLVTVAVPLSRALVSAIVAAGGSVPNDLSETIERLAAISSFYYGAWGTAATVVLGYASSLLFKPPPSVKLAGLTHYDPPPVLAEVGESDGRCARPHERI
jgi:SSS family transporter